jgi:PAS domain S-box-containing protein
MSGAAARHLRAILVLSVLLSGYVVAGKLGLTLAFFHVSASPVWPPTGIALAALLLLGGRVWPAIFLGAFLVNVTTAGSVATSLGIAAGNTLEAALGAALVTRFAHGRHAFDRARDVFTFAVLAGLVSTMVAATVGVTSLALGGYARWTDFAAIWLTWWLGDAAGAIVVAPLLVLWAAPSERRFTLASRGESGLMLVAVALVGTAVFTGPYPVLHPLAFLCGPPLVWAAFRCGQRESATAVALLSGLAIWGTLRGLGPFVRESPNESLLLLQAYMVTMNATALPLAAVVAERRRARAALAHVAAIVDSSDDAVVGQTLEGVVTHWNGAAERLYAYPAREAIGRPMTMVMPPERPEELPRILERLRRGEHVDHYETVRVRRDGRRVEVSVMVSPLRDDTGRVIGASCVARDITERKEAEAARRERDLLRWVGSLAAAAAHEINNPLAVLMGQAQLLAGEIGAVGERRIDEMLRAIARIHDIVSRMNGIRRFEVTPAVPHVPEMLDLTRSSTRPPPVDVPDALPPSRGDWGAPGAPGPGA